MGSDRLPRQLGWYWYRHSPSSEWQPVKLIGVSSVVMVALDTVIPLDRLTGEWGDRLSPPASRLAAPEVPKP